MPITPDEQKNVDRLIARIEMAVGALPQRDGPNAVLIKTIIESCNGLRSVLGVVRTH